MARPHPLGGMDARSEIAKIHNLKPPRARTILLARPHALHARVMALTRPRDELNDIRPKQHKYVARSRPSLGARARPCVRTMAVARPCPRVLSSRTNYCKMDKKGKAKCPVCKMYASQAAARSEATSKPPIAPKAPEEPKKKPIFIDLTTDSESEDTTRASSETHFSSVASFSEGHFAPR
ncbi:hypothetical protein PIB30_063926 [Stylosanthes scabra]|uniref:Uncharacterized protein n=1 Tax=Stylosanthes scabra TaxID=79078 RepID=A0ABU6XLQ7_9FABA|nr:hypothetical protein [Stylosanthes scabra]